MHPQLGTPQIYHDQMNIIAQHLWEIKNEPEWNLASNEEIFHPISDDMICSIIPKYGKKLKCNKLWYQHQSLPTWYKIAKLKKKK